MSSVKQVGWIQLEFFLQNYCLVKRTNPINETIPKKISHNLDTQTNIYKVFDEYAKDTHLFHITRLSENVTKLDLVWGFYLLESENCCKSRASERSSEMCVRFCSHSQELTKLSEFGL